MEKQELTKEVLRRMMILGIDKESQNQFKSEGCIYMPSTLKLTEEQLSKLNTRVKEYNNDEYVVYGALPIDGVCGNELALLIATTNKGKYISENAIVMCGGLIKTYVINLEENSGSNLRYYKLKKNRKAEIIGVE